MYPIIFTPDYKERVWGGEKLKTLLNKNIPYPLTGESWELAAHKNGQSIVANGEYKGLTLQELLVSHGKDLIGKEFNEGDKFPLLIKFIDAKNDLSVQVHPEDDYANIHENGELGKSEAWYVLQADEGATLVAGLVEGTTKELFREKLNKNQLEDVLATIEVKKGDVLNIPAGLLHAIGSGVLLAEVQQNSDTTYRVYDWGRVGLDGKPRELHVEKSLDVIDFDNKHSKEIAKGKRFEYDGYSITEYVQCDYFVLEEVIVTEFMEVNKEASFEIYMVVDGECVIEYGTESLEVGLGTTLMLPADLSKYVIKTKSGVTLVRSYLPK